MTSLLQTSILNKHLQELMDGLTAKVFRTYNASITLQQQLNELTTRKYRSPYGKRIELTDPVLICTVCDPKCICSAEDNIPARILSYNRANRAVAILCNHQRAPPKTFEKSMLNLQTKV